MSWQNYVIPVIASSTLMIGCWYIGHFGFSFLWIIVFVALYVLKTHMWIRREQKRMRLRNMILREQETIIAQFGGQVDDLPAWVQFPDTERIESVNKIIQQLWPYIGEYANKFTREFVEPQVRAQMPKPFKSFKFLEIDCGDMPFRVGGLKVYTENVGRDKIIVDMDVIYAGDAQFSVKVCGFEGGINQVVLSGKIRCVLQPLLSYLPMIGGVSASFIELPKFDFNLTGMGEFVQLPGLINAIRSVINTQIANMCVLPNAIVVPLAPDIDIIKLYLPEPDGIIRLKIVEARNLENKDSSFFTNKDKSDPYCEIQVGSQFFKTHTINNDLNPVFNECFEAVVDQASGQMLRLALFDEDTTSADEELGRLSIPLDIVRSNGEIDQWYHLEGCKHGELHIKVCWLRLSTEIENIKRDKWESEWIQSDKPMHPALLTVFVDHVVDLPYPKSNLEPSPFIELILGSVSQRTPVKVKTVNPLFQSKFLFFVKQPEGQELKIKAIDDGTRRELGDLSIPLIDVIRQPQMEISRQTFLLQRGIHTSRIVLTLRFRTFEPQNGPIFDVASDYGTGSHIERAERNHVNSNGVHLQRQTITTPFNNNNTAKYINAEIVSPEPGKTVENHDILTPETQLNTNNFSLLRRSASILTNTSVNTTGEGSITGSSRTESKMNGSRLLNLSKLKETGSKLVRKVSKKNLRDMQCGEIQLGMSYDKEKFMLYINIICAKDLCPGQRDSQASPYVTLKLLPLDASFKPKGKRKTEPVENSLNPQFNSELVFDVHYSELPKYKLHLAVKNSSDRKMIGKPLILGRVDISLRDFNPNVPTTTQWYNLKAS